MGLDELVHALLYEGYALYPYTPGAVKNATPTPFGIIYPPAYACEHPEAAFDHARAQCLAELGAGATLGATLGARATLSAALLVHAPQRRAPRGARALP